jgi:isoquinoline 1-oxidoreductase alpha subunit
MSDIPLTVLSGRGTDMARMTINGKTTEVTVNPSTPLLWAIREQVGLTGTKYGCGVAQCGACTVHIDGKAVRSCIMAVAALLKDKPKPTDADIDGTITNICRCGTFQQVREAIHAAAKA